MNEAQNHLRSIYKNGRLIRGGGTIRTWPSRPLALTREDRRALTVQPGPIIR